MPNSRDFVAHVLELATAAGRPSARAMFGGHGLYLDGAFVGILAGDTLYLKCDQDTVARFDERDLEPFEYTKKDGGALAMSYRRAPDEALESAPAMREWLMLALGASLRAAASRPRRRRPSPA